MQWAALYWALQVNAGKDNVLLTTASLQENNRYESQGWEHFHCSLCEPRVQHMEPFLDRVFFLFFLTSERNTPHQAVAFDRVTSCSQACAACTHFQCAECLVRRSLLPWSGYSRSCSTQTVFFCSSKILSLMILTRSSTPLHESGSTLAYKHGSVSSSFSLERHIFKNSSSESTFRGSRLLEENITHCYEMV